jgi:hypothetical protein
MDRPPAGCSCSGSAEDPAAPSAAEAVVRITIATLPAYLLAGALADYERDRAACPLHVLNR